MFQSIISWHLILLALILYKYGIAQILIKRVGAVEGSRTRKLVWQFFFAALFALAFQAWLGTTGHVSIDVIIFIAGIGAINSFACYCHWRSYDISMSKTSMLMNLDDLTAMGLGLLFLGEVAVFSPVILAGVLVSVTCASTFMYAKSRKKKEDSSGGGLIKWVLGYSIIWGIASFAMRYFVQAGTPIASFITYWYSGAWLGALVVRYLIMGKDEAGETLSRSQLANVFILAFVIFTCMIFTVWIRKLLPLNVIHPIELIAEMAIPSAIGYWYFKEKQSLSLIEKIALLGGIIGAVALIAAF